MWLVNLVFLAVAACLLQKCHGDVQVNAQRVESRFLGTLNRYYVYSWDRGNGTEYIDLDNTADAINDLGLGGDENVNPEDTTPNPEGTTPNPEGTTANPEDTTPNPEGTTSNPEVTVPNPEDTTPNPEDTTPNPEDTTPNPEDTTPNPENTTPNPEDTTPNPEDTTPNPEGTTSNPEDTTPNPEDTTPNPEDTTPNPEDTTLNPEDTTPNPDGTTPNPEDTTPNPEDTTPNPEDTTPNPEDTTLNPEDTTPNPDGTTPNPEDTTPNPEDTTPNLENTTPNPEDTTPNPEDTTPNPEGTTSNPEDTTPNPEDTTPNPEDTTPNPEDTTPNPEGTTPNPEDTTPNQEDTMPNPNVREYKTKDFVIVIHGREDSAFGNFGQTLKESFVMSDYDLIVIVVDWSFVANRDYTTAFNAASFIADDIRTLIRHLQAAIKTVHIVGFDLGAHIAGIISRHSSVNVQRITGLSPAGQNWGANSQRLRPTDAEYVEVIHTDYTGARAFGIGDIIGTVDMYANTGTNQPGCSNNLCHHNRAWQLFAASLDFGGHLVGLGCNSITDMTRNRCANPPGVTLGTNALSKRGTGIYRVNTGRTYPYNT